MATTRLFKRDDDVPTDIPRTGSRFLDAGLVVLKTHGPSVVMMFVLVWFLIHHVSGALDSIQATMGAAHTNMSTYVAEEKAWRVRMEDDEKRRIDLLNLQIRINRQQCANAAGPDNMAGRRACWE